MSTFILTMLVGIFPAFAEDVPTLFGVGGEIGMTNIFGNKVPGLLLRGLIRGCLALVFGRNQAACAVEVGREPLFARYDGLQAGSVLDRWFLSFDMPNALS
jgi:hypothetical protein